jgi:hypothetical protein
MTNADDRELTPQPGLVIRYSYLWESEARVGREEGSKDRPCAIVLAATSQAGESNVYVLPVTHSEPHSEEGVEVPAVVKRRLGLDPERSWIIVSEANSFIWPGPDVRPLPNKGLTSAVYGFLPPRLFRTVRDLVVMRARAGRIRVVKRTE